VLATGTKNICVDAAASSVPDIVILFLVFAEDSMMMPGSDSP
jgi:hypothetical protein